ncbi:hypothetical protein B0A49_07082 [Cryomyces minteri]|uniref:Uncharacterized protein n=1 Tax=Cryomyces minteri TaxID=331657 RepID=A0A4U0WRY1_9PEZI|nr:hypothetical protein B0A49_07082 [Cryomyces minteri]
MSTDTPPSTRSLERVDTFSSGPSQHSHKTLASSVKSLRSKISSSTTRSSVEEGKPAPPLPFSITVSTSISRSTASKPKPEPGLKNKASALSGHSSTPSKSSDPSSDPWRNESVFTGFSTSHSSSEPWVDGASSRDNFESITTLISHSVTKAPLYQLSAPLSSRSPRITLSRYKYPRKLYDDAPLPSSSTSVDPKPTPVETEPLYDLVAIPFLSHDRIANRCELRSHGQALPGASSGARSAIVQLGVGLHGFTTTVTANPHARLLLQLKRGEWRDADGRTVAVVKKAAAAKDVVADIEFIGQTAAGAGEERRGVNDLVVAAWCAGLWMRTTMPAPKETRVVKLAGRGAETVRPGSSPGLAQLLR